MTQTPISAQANLRSLVLSLAQCEGWTQWALPLLRKIIGDHERPILNATNLSSSEVMELRRAYRTLTHDFLGVLEKQASHALKLSTLSEPAATQAEVDNLIAAAFRIDPARFPSAITAESPSPPPAEEPLFDPFAGTPQPITKLTPTPS